MVLAAIAIFWSKYSKKYMKDWFESLRNFIKRDSLWNYAIYYAIDQVFAFFVLPGASYWYMALAFFLQDFWKAFLIVLLSKKPKN